jgi:O6-methylguanine-DNA--protein-cysteine methyltransferase
MEEQVRRIDADFNLGLSDDEIKRIAREAEVQQRVLDVLKTVDLGQTRPVQGFAKWPRAKAGKQGRP